MWNLFWKLYFQCLRLWDHCTTVDVQGQDLQQRIDPFSWSGCTDLICQMVSTVTFLNRSGIDTSTSTSNPVFLKPLSVPFLPPKFPNDWVLSCCASREGWDYAYQGSVLAGLHVLHTEQKCPLEKMFFCQQTLLTQLNVMEGLHFLLFINLFRCGRHKVSSLFNKQTKKNLSIRATLLH